MCGLFGVINKHKRLLDKRAFITLGCANDSRGGDSCGIMIDGKVEKGTLGNDKYFQDWFTKSKLLNTITTCSVALGHCRKASVGAKTAKEAQPVEIRDGDGKLLFCLIHNGTIYNYEELAEKYIPDIDIKGMTDSQVMAHIFFFKGYDVLGEYRGGGAFVMHDYRNNNTYIFRGASKVSSTCKTAEDERPFYYVKTGKSVIFSSIFAILQGLYWKFPVYDLPSNTLIRCDGEKLFIVKKYDRSNINSYKTVQYYTSNLWDNANSLKPSKVDYDTDSGMYIDTSTGEILNGEYDISRYGYIIDYPTVYTDKFYFYKGILISGKTAYDAIMELEKEKIKESKLIAIVRRLSCNPVLMGRKYYSFNTNNTKERFSGCYTFPLTSTTIMCSENGKLIADYEVSEVLYTVPVELPKECVNIIINYVKTNIQ